VHSRLSGIEMARLSLEMDVIVPEEIASGAIRTETVDGESTEILSARSSCSDEQYAERMKQFVETASEEDDGPRRNLATTILGDAPPDKVSTAPSETEAHPVTERRYTRAKGAKRDQNSVVRYVIGRRRGRRNGGSSRRTTGAATFHDTRDRSRDRRRRPRQER
jgi:hypothetical protein